MEGMDEKMIEDIDNLEEHYDALTNEEFIALVTHSFDEEDEEGDEEDFTKEIKEVFIPKLVKRIEQSDRQSTEIVVEFCNLLESLGKCYLEIEELEKAFESYSLIQQYLQVRTPSNPTREFCALYSAAWIKMAAVSTRLGNHTNAINFYQNAANIIVPRIFEHSDMTPVPSLISICTHRIGSCVQEKSWKILKDDLQTVATVGDILEQLTEITQSQGVAMEVHGLVFDIKAKRKEFIETLREYLDIDTLKNILKSFPEIEIDPQDCNWIIQEYNKTT